VSRGTFRDVSLTFGSVIKGRKENITPKPMMEPLSPLSTPPSSPSKRRGSVSHYSGLECSPSKRRGVAEHAISRMADEERKPLFTSEVSNAPAPIKVDRRPVYQTPVKKGRITTGWAGSPMHVDGEGDGDVWEGGKVARKSISDLFGSPMKVDRPGVVESGSLRKPLPGLPISVGIPVRNRVRGKPVVAL